MNNATGYAIGKRFSIAVSFALPLLVFADMLAAFLLLDAVLPLKYLQFIDALLTRLGRWPAGPALLLFPGWALSIPVPGAHLTAPATPPRMLAWGETGLLLCTFLVVFLVYLLALRSLPRRITPRYIFFSTLFIGLVCVTIPVVTSSDVFSYIAYARMGVIYHLNPLTTLPVQIHSDPVYQYIYWTNQPSAYGPVWVIISGALQILVDAFGFKDIAAMILALRLFGLAMHLGSTMLIWSISGYLMGRNAPYLRGKRLLLTLAFAWNPLLLFEACVNAHNDATVLFLLLLTLWLIVRKWSSQRGVPTANLLLAAVLFALATCLKLNMAVLIPGFFLFVCLLPQRWRNIAGTAITYMGVIVALYLPFWQRGAVLNVLRVNPGTYRSANSLADFATHLDSSLVILSGHRFTNTLYLSTRHFFHTLSIAIFIGLFALLCVWAIYRWRETRTPSGLIRWLATAWLFYCLVGSPWFWPWYIVTFFGLYALVEATTGSERSPFRNVDVTGAVRLLAFSMLSLYCFATWATDHVYIAHLSLFVWSYLGGLWIWLLPLLALRLVRRRKLPGFLPFPRMLAPPDREQTLVS
ncbi:MAG TPA: glycosyltransferase family 39 protein [Ktedonobacteraceae bacterium]|nr:glycosyltransferase family 39 protein [Ktedonobacteraceae bacterium]